MCTDGTDSAQSRYTEHLNQRHTRPNIKQTGYSHVARPCNVDSSMRGGCTCAAHWCMIHLDMEQLTPSSAITLLRADCEDLLLPQPSELPEAETIGDRNVLPPGERERMESGERGAAREQCSVGETTVNLCSPWAHWELTLSCLGKASVKTLPVRVVVGALRTPVGTLGLSADKQQISGTLSGTEWLLNVMIEGNTIPVSCSSLWEH